MTNLEDTLAAVHSGADAVGFNFVPTSPRYLAEAALARWIGQVPADVWKVGVFADQTAEDVKTVCARLDLQVAQLHGSESPADVPQDIRVWKATRIRPGLPPPVWDEFDIEAVLLDGPASGIPFDWSSIQIDCRKIILAGGLDSSNVQGAVNRLRPWGVDACSRIEISPGRKDHRLMEKFIKMASSC